jgi:hypothetical protein
VRAEFIAPSDARWSAFLARVPHDVYHLPDYAELSSSIEQGRPAAFLAESDGAACLIPLILRDLPQDLRPVGDWYDATSPYGYPGPLATEPMDSGTLGRFLAAFRELGAAVGLVSAFIRLHPLLPFSPVALRTLGTVETHGHVVLVDLAPSQAELWAATRENHRTGIRKLERRGYVPVLDDWELLPEFVRLYEATMRRVNAAPFYFFAPGYYDALRARLGRRVHLCAVRAPDGRVACAGLFFEEAGIVQYHLGGTADEFLAIAPSKLMFDFVRRWAKERGNRILHLGGGIGGREDSLFHFKAGFSALRAEFQTLRVVFNEDGYETLANRSRAETAGTTGYFPAYRAPRPCRLS